MDPVVLSMLTQRGFFHDAAALVLAVTALHQHIMQPQTLPSAAEGVIVCVCYRGWEGVFYKKPGPL